MVDFKSKAKLSAIGFSVLALMLCITIFGLDIHIQEQTKQKLSIAFHINNSTISYDAINVAFYVLTILYIILNIALIVLTIIDFHPTIFVSTLGLLLLYLPKEAILLKFYSCFNHYDHSFIIARSILTFIFCLVLSLFGISCIFVLDKIRKILHRAINLLTYPSFVLSIVTLLAIIAINIALAAILKPPLLYDTSPHKIQMGFFSKSDINRIQNGVFIKDNSYDQNIIGNLSMLVDSDKTFSKSGLLYRSYDRTITCYGNDGIYEIDCNSKSYLTIRVIYRDRYAYPSYNCARYSRTLNGVTCSPGCHNLMDWYNLYLVQENNNIIYTAWDRFSNCELKPSFTLTKDSTIDLCSAAILWKSEYSIFIINFILFYKFSRFNF
ncbi:hypothetical protein BpHYR1_001587 [Brachionus plicatilis]|uniref:Uncharacterized protein n=1 Tax=Brachionus plicatilis TaxID=10195 RepID=A0A3M7QJ49_BRAPC|nr:hypothetical protein BpHYR1_001587 [Brachionus plicatilis]